MWLVWQGSDVSPTASDLAKEMLLQLIVLFLGIGIFAIVAYGDVRTRRIPNELIVAILALAAFRIAMDGDPRAGLYTLAAAGVLARDRLGLRRATTPPLEAQEAQARLTVPYGVAIAAAGIVVLLVQ